ncbi:hypothetical protein, partial [Nocardiopsis dassonvillei]|uniref:hypothetical protein n=1 Tax=Nocardiopsis dassonvillei TaxID=2014 RepID=UPI001EE3632B
GNPQPATAATVAEPDTRPTTPGRPMAPIIDLDALRNGVGRTAQPAASTASGTTAAKAVLALLAEGPRTRAQLIRSLAGREGCGETAVKGALKALAAAGRVERTRESQKAPYVLTR